jgi:hypothetical protein
LYIDDSGTKEYATKPEEYDSRRGNSRFFVFCGALLTTGEAGHLTNNIVQLKLAYFGEETVEIKSNWLRIPHERKRHYLDPFGLSEAQLTEFVDRYYEVVTAAPLAFIAAVVDKLHVQETYPKPHYAPAIAYELVMQRVQNELPTGSVAVIIDDMSGATPKGNQYKANLKMQHLKLRKYGSGLKRGFDFPCLSSQKFVNSASSQIIQVADVAAYNVHRQFMQYGEQWEQSGVGTLSMYEHFEKITGKFRRDAEGRVQGYGIVKFPLRNRVYWSVADKK